jgi:hypothetical protein
MLVLGLSGATGAATRVQKAWTLDSVQNQFSWLKYMPGSDGIRQQSWDVGTLTLAMRGDAMTEVTDDITPSLNKRQDKQKTGSFGLKRVIVTVT